MALGFEALELVFAFRALRFGAFGFWAVPTRCFIGVAYCRLVLIKQPLKQTTTGPTIATEVRAFGFL